VGLVQAYGWQRTVLLASIGFAFAASASTWSSALSDASVETTQIDVTYDSFADPLKLGIVLDGVKTKATKVVMVLAATEDLKHVALRADEMGMVSKGWVWISDSFCARVDDGSNTTAVRTARDSVCGGASTDGDCRCLPCLQAAAVRKALHGWIYVLPFEPQTLSMRKFQADVRNATERNFDTKLGSAPIDTAAAALYDAVMLWARAASRVLARGGAVREVRRRRRMAACSAIRQCTVQATSKTDWCCFRPLALSLSQVRVEAQVGCQSQRM
jgi:hypothetical protein